MFSILGKILLHLVVIVGVVPVGDLFAGCLPDAGMRTYITQRFVQEPDPVRLAYDVRVKTERQYATVMLAFLIHRIEIILDERAEILRFMALSFIDRVAQV